MKPIHTLPINRADDGLDIICGGPWRLLPLWEHATVMPHADPRDKRAAGVLEKAP